MRRVKLTVPPAPGIRPSSISGRPIWVSPLATTSAGECRHLDPATQCQRRGCVPRSGRPGGGSGGLGCARAVSRGRWRDRGACRTRRDPRRTRSTVRSRQDDLVDRVVDTAIASALASSSRSWAQMALRRWGRSRAIGAWPRRVSRRPWMAHVRSLAPDGQHATPRIPGPPATTSTPPTLPPAQPRRRATLDRAARRSATWRCEGLRRSGR